MKSKNFYKLRQVIGKKVRNKWFILLGIFTSGLLVLFFLQLVGVIEINNKIGLDNFLILMSTLLLTAWLAIDVTSAHNKKTIEFQILSQQLDLFSTHISEINSLVIHGSSAHALLMQKLTDSLRLLVAIKSQKCIPATLMADLNEIFNDLKKLRSFLIGDNFNGLGINNKIEDSIVTFTSSNILSASSIITNITSKSLTFKLNLYQA
jgi:hypothetical protein